MRVYLIISLAIFTILFHLSFAKHITHQVQARNVVNIHDTIEDLTVTSTEALPPATTVTIPADEHVQVERATNIWTVDLLFEIIHGDNQSCSESTLANLIKHALLKAGKKTEDIEVSIEFHATSVSEELDNNTTMSHLFVTITSLSDLDLKKSYDSLKSFSLNPSGRNETEDVILGDCWLKFDPRVVHKAVLPDRVERTVPDGMGIYFGYQQNWMISLIVICFIVIILALGCLIIACWSRRTRNQSKIHEADPVVKFKADMNAKTPILAPNRLKIIKSAPQLKEH